MTEIETIGTRQQFDAAPTASVDIAEWLTRAAGAEQLARALVKSNFVPDSFKPRHNPNNAEESERAYDVAVANTTAAILAGQSIGLDPLTALQTIFVVSGKPAMYAKMQVAVLKRIGHEIWVEEYTPDAVTVCGRARGSSREVRVRLTIEDAKRAGWTKNDTYAKTPADMLYARCAARVCAQIDPGALMGIPCADAPDTDPTPDAWATVAAAPTQAAMPAPPVIPALPGPAPVRITRAEQPPKMAAKSTLADIRRRLSAMSVPDDDRPRVVATLVGRPVTRLDELTAIEADALCGALHGDAAYDTVGSVLGWDTGTGEILATPVE